VGSEKPHRASAAAYSIPEYEVGVKIRMQVKNETHTKRRKLQYLYSPGAQMSRGKEKILQIQDGSLHQTPDVVVAINDCIRKEDER
jgi:hypothetical protein